MGLETASLLYRRPELYDALNAPDTAAIWSLVRRRRPAPPESVLDLGCGTGSFLSSLPGYVRRKVGIDVQPGMVAYALAAHPELDVRVGDIRTVRLDERFDVITCIGLSLAYLLEVEDLSAGLATITAHAHEDSVVVIHTLTTPVDDTETTATIRAAGQTGTATTRYQWQEPFVLTHRRWTLDDGSAHTDMLCRRVWPVDVLRTALADTGLRLAAETDNYLVAVATGHSDRRRGEQAPRTADAGAGAA